MVADYASSVLLPSLQVLRADVECELGHSGCQCSCAGVFGVGLFDDGGFAVDTAELFPSRVLRQRFALLCIVRGGCELLRYLAEVVELRVLPLRGCNLGVIELGECREAGDRVE